jgi:hypothetical protein
MPEQERWQIVTYLKSLKNSTSPRTNDSASSEVRPVKTNAPPPQAPFTDFRFEQPGKVRRIAAQDLPARTQFPAEYRGDIFASEHGSWNRSVRTGYEVIRVPRHQTNRASGEYEDFVTGFVVDNGHVWGRPVGITVAQDGSLLVTDDGSNSIWRISYSGADSQQRERDDASQPMKTTSR